MTDYDKLMGAVMSPEVKTAAATFVDELVSSTMLAVRQDPRAYGFVTLKEHDARVTELLEANNAELARRRAAEAKSARFDFDVLAAIQSLPLGCGNESAASALTEIVGRTDLSTPVVTPLTCGGCGHTVGSILSCSVKGCPVMAARKAAA